jgi:hypothetical protein
VLLQVGFMRGQLSRDTRRLLRQLAPASGGSGSSVVLSPIPHWLPCDPDAEDEGAAELLIQHTGKPCALLEALCQVWNDWKGGKGDDY